MKISNTNIVDEVPIADMKFGETFACKNVKGNGYRYFIMVDARNLQNQIDDDSYPCAVELCNGYLSEFREKDMVIRVQTKEELEFVRV